MARIWRAYICRSSIVFPVLQALFIVIKLGHIQLNI